MEKYAVYIVCAIIELLLYSFKSAVESILNSRLAASQMSIETGYLYANAIKTTDFIWAVCAIAVAVAGIVYYLVMKKGNKE